MPRNSKMEHPLHLLERMMSTVPWDQLEHTMKQKADGSMEFHIITPSRSKQVAQQPQTSNVVQTPAVQDEEPMAAAAERNDVIVKVALSDQATVDALKKKYSSKFLRSMGIIK